MNIRLSDESVYTLDGNAYECVESVIMAMYAYLHCSFVVELETKYKCDDTPRRFSTLLLYDGENYDNPHYIWEDDWWEGEEDVKLIAVAPSCDIELPKKWRLKS